MKTALITGALGQDGYFLTKRLLELGHYKIICTSYNSKTPFNSLYLHKNIIHEHLDIRNEYEIINLIKHYQPDDLYHLASFSSPIISWENPKNVIYINGSCTINILEAMRQFSKKTKLFFASSGKIFGKSKLIEQNENSPVDPLDPYSLGKYIGHQAVKLYRTKYDLFACNGILYNHESYLKDLNFVVRKICHYSLLLKDHRISSFPLLNLDSAIDIGDPRDYVVAMNLILSQAKPGDYIISMSKTYLIKEICLQVGKILGIKNILSYIRVSDTNSKHTVRPFKSNNTKLRLIQWRPQYNLVDTLKLILFNE